MDDEPWFSPWIIEFIEQWSEAGEDVIVGFEQVRANLLTLLGDASHEEPSRALAPSRAYLLQGSDDHNIFTCSDLVAIPGRHSSFPPITAVRSEPFRVGSSGVVVLASMLVTDGWRQRRRRNAR